MLSDYQCIKSVLDRLFAFGGLFVLFPLLALLFLCVYLDVRAVIFTQDRPGYLVQPFKIYKLKTMKDGVGNDRQRTTRLGRFLRQWSLDELPQLVNILKGEMSFVGPRPYLMQYLTLYSERHTKRHHVLPGMTGWAQVHGGNALDWAKKLDMDVYYAEHYSFFLDMKIVWRTLCLFFKGRKKDLHASAFTGYRKADLTLEK